jgi:signal transduction histidine kinase
MVADVDSAGGRARRLRLRGLSVGVLAVFALAAVGLFIGTSRVAADQNKRLLVERTAEVGELLSGALATGLGSSLTLLAATGEASTAASFTRSAQALKTSDAVAAVALIEHRGSSWVVEAAVGKALTAGQTITGPRLLIVQSAGAKLHSDVFVVSTTDSRLGAAIGPPVSSPGTVLYEEYIVDPARPSTLTQSQPFHELNAALYVAHSPVASKLLLSTTPRVPLRGRTASSPIAVGDGSWLVVASARQPLAGALANDVPAILTAAVLIIGIAMTVVVEGVGRRRDYALSLVANRTTALQDSLQQLEHTQQALVAHERLAALGQMAATVGHELRNPLGVLTNSLYLIRNTVSGEADEKLRRHLDTADREICAATLIVSDLLEFSRPRTANPIPIDLAELLDEAISVAPPPTGITVKRDDGGVPVIVADRDQIRQVILNLLTNAYEAMPNGGEVGVGARIVDDAVEVVVSDTGIGMDPQTRAQVFEPFFSMKIKGTGLGLAVSKRIVEAHAGTLKMISEEGQGCTAVVTLPLTPAEFGARQ